MQTAQLGIAAPGSVGRSCVADWDCASGLVCAGDACACSPGLAACAGACVDLASDAEHCGACWHKCSAVENCTAGACGQHEINALASFDVPFQISGGDPTTSCKLAEEAFPERCATFGDAAFFVPYMANDDLDRYNWASSATSWSASLWSVPVTAGYTRGGDPWATTSGHTGLEYASFITSTGTTNCLGIAAGYASQIDNGTWAYPVACAAGADQYIDDGPAIHYDLGAANLFAVSALTNSIPLYIFQNCEVGAPGGGACPLTSAVTVYQGPWQGHPSVAANPSTHNAVVAYRDYQTTDYIWLKFYTPSGVSTGSFQVNAAAYPVVEGCNPSGCGEGVWGNVPKCTALCGGDCGSVGCWRLAPRAHVVTKYDSSTAKSYAYVAFDYKCSVAGSDGKKHVKAALAIVDITNESAPIYKHSWISSSCSTSDNDFSSVPAVNQFTNNVGFFFYRQQGGNACNTYFGGRTDSALGLTNMSAVSLISGPFKSMRGGLAYGMGDYIGAIKRGLPGGYLFPSWSEPVATSVPCYACQGTQYSIRTMATRVLP